MAWKCVMYEPIEWRVNDDGSGRSRWFRAPDGTEHTFKTLPIGAMFYDDECQRQDCKKPDGRCLVVKLPGLIGGVMRGILWHIDHPTSDDGPGWTRTGTPPNVTATPSINFVGYYHGWLTNGVLSDDVEGRTFDGGTG